MQNNPDKKQNKLKDFLREKGYYIVLALCVAAVGVSGWLFVRSVSGGADSPVANVPTLSVPLTPASETGEQPSQGGSDTAPNVQMPVIPTVPTPGSAEIAAETMAPAEEVMATDEPSATVRPLAGEMLTAWSGDTLTYNETLRDWRVHEGVDIAAAPGTAVMAARDGMVSAVYDDERMGTTVEVEHRGGYTTIYANLSTEPPVRVGQAVSAGEAIGTVGDTAVNELALASHLHFAVSCSGQDMDPQVFLES